ncbi:stage III sporulation protein AF [Desulfovirgula thermocuniculi]|uniref:stage III sporulation protein AF n=1 Tax=Desulfovirgula thermocuniculi TaxID=348842 RepID=UPI000408442E|nr:stage III sporulation protein AF [Desulfovirgula thermocuniculi]
MEQVQRLVQNLVVVVVLGVFLEMFLPQNEMRRYVRLVVGLLIVVAVLQAIGGLVKREWQEVLPEPALSVQPPGSAKLPEIMAAGKELQALQQERALEEYRRGLARQISALAGMGGNVEVKEVQVEIYDRVQDKHFGQIREVSLLLAPAGKAPPYRTVEPVTVRMEQPGQEPGGGAGEGLPPEMQEAVERVTRILGNFYNLNPSQIKVRVEMP